MPTRATQLEELPWESQVSEFLVCPPNGVQPPQSRKIRVDFISADDDSAERGCTRTCHRRWASAKQSLSLMPAHFAIARKDQQERPWAFWLSFASVAFVVALCSILITIVASLPVVFLKLSEIDTGQVDLAVSAGGAAMSAASLNYTRVAEHVQHLTARGVIADDYNLHFPSMSWSATAYSLAQCGNASSANALWYLGSDLATKIAPSVPSAARDHLVCSDGCFRSHCGNDAGPRVTVMGLDPALTGSRLFTDEDTTAVLSRLTADVEEIDDDNGKDGASDRMGTHVMGTVVLNENVANALAVVEGDHIVLTGRVGDTLRALATAGAFSVGDWVNNQTIVEVRVVGIVSASYGETFMGTDQWVVVHYAAIPRLIAASASPVIPRAQLRGVAASDPYAAAHAIHFTIGDGTRDDAYLRTGYKNIRAQVALWSSPLVDALGSGQVSVSPPVLTFMSTLDFFSTFMGLIMGILVGVFAVLSTLLNYSLLTMSLERRRYEIGVQRMLGFTRADVACLVLTQSYLYTVPAWAVGLVGGQVFYFFLRLLLQWVAGVSLRMWLAWNGIGFGTVLALLIPLVASVFPIRSLLMERLAEALDTTRGTELSGVRYKIKVPAKEHVKTSYMAGGLGLAFAGFGIAIYYLLPLSLIRLDLSTLFTIFFAVLLGMICGLVVLTSNGEFVAQFLVLHVLIGWWEKRSVLRCTLKNLTAHRLRNRRTTLLYTLSVSLAIFLTVMLNINFNMLQFIAYRNVGNCLTGTFQVYSMHFNNQETVVTTVSTEATLLRRMRDSAVSVTRTDNVTNSATSFVEYALDGPEARTSAAFLSDYTELQALLQPLIDSGVIVGVTYRLKTFADSLPSRVASISCSTFGRYTSDSRTMNLVPPNHFDVLDDEFVVLREGSDAISQFGLAEGLYTADSSRRVLLATSFAKSFALQTLNDTFLSATRFRSSAASDLLDGAGWPTTRYSVLAPAAVLDSTPIYFMTRFPNNMGEFIMSIPTGVAVSGTPFLSVEQLPLQQLEVRLADASDAPAVKRIIRSFLDARNLYTNWHDANSSVSDIKVAFRFLSALLIFAQVMIYVVCFFSLMSSMTTNVLASSKEIGVMLALGMQHGELYRTFIWEALTLIVSSGLLGAIIGLIMAYTIQIQNSVLNQITMPFTFATRELLMLVALGIVSALLASYSPVRFLLNMPSTAQIFAFN